MAEQDEALARLQAALENLAAADASELVAAARAEARARVRDMLTDALAGSLLDAARREIEGQERPSAGPASAPARQARPADSGTGWYVYCVTADDGPPLPEGLPGVDPAHAVTSLRVGRLAAIVSAVPLSEFDEERLREHLGDMSWVERVARRHEEVLEAVNAQRSVVPMRMCTIYRDEAGVQAMLTREAAAMSTALDELQGKSEWGVKVFAAPRGGPRPRAEREREATGAAYMQQRQREQQERGEADQRRGAAAEGIFARLGAVAARASVIPPQRPEVSGHPGVMVLNSVYLVSDDELGAFHDTVAELQSESAELGLELQVTGPWPAYNFVPDAIGAAP